MSFITSPANLLFAKANGLGEVRFKGRQIRSDHMPIGRTDDQFIQALFEFYS